MQPSFLGGKYTPTNSCLNADKPLCTLKVGYCYKLVLWGKYTLTNSYLNAYKISMIYKNNRFTVDFQVL